MFSLIIILTSVAFIGASPIGQNNTSQLGKSSRIVAGNYAQPTQFPWQVALHYQTPNGPMFCGGSLISNQWILTAAHCVYQSSNFKIHLGSISLSDPDRNRIETTSAKKIVHPYFSSKTLDNDVALLQLSKPVKLNQFIQPIDLSTIRVQPGWTAISSGWGNSYTGSSLSPFLKFVSLTTISGNECRLTFYDVNDNGKICCKGYSIESICSGDSGGPLIAYTDNGVPIHIGVNSFGVTSSCEQGHPSGFAETAYYRNWIRAMSGV